MKKTCLLFGEGGRDRNFLQALVVCLDKKYGGSWFFTVDNASGVSPRVVIEQCQRIGHNNGAIYDQILCFVDLDQLRQKTGKQKGRPNWEEKRDALERQYPGIKIVWQIDNAEDEYKKVLGSLVKGRISKHRLNKLAKDNIKMFIGSDFWNRIIKLIDDN